MALSRASFVLLLCASGINGQDKERDRSLFTVSSSLGQEIVSTTSGKCIDADTGTWPASGTKLQLWECKGEKSQQWMFIYYHLVNPASVLCLDASGGRFLDEGTKLELRPCALYNLGQLWERSGDKIKNLFVDKCIDANMKTFPADGTTLQLWDCDSHAGQKWTGGGGGHPQHSHHPHHPQPQCAAWPTFASANDLATSPWGAYFKALYGSSPPADRYPLDVGSWWMLWDDLLSANNVPLPKSSGMCAPANCQLSLYRQNNAYSPPNTQWIWHPPPYHPSDYAPPGQADPWIGWVEIVHKRDPFGDEHYGEWFNFAKGSAVWYHTGNSIKFEDHKEAYAHFGKNDNEGMCQAAAAAGYDTVIFLAHPDHVNYPCDTAGKYPYMNVEIVAVKLKGTYSCGVAGKPDPGVLRSGWATDADACNCDNALEVSNCGHLIRSLSPEAASRFQGRGGSFLESASAGTKTMPTGDALPIGTNSEIPTVGLGAMVTPTVWEAADAGDGRSRLQMVEMPAAPHRPPGDCTRNHSAAADPPWFATCKVDGVCLRVTVNSSTLHGLNIGNSTDGPTFALGFQWCIDHLNHVVYAKMNGTQPSQPPYYGAYFEVDYPLRPARNISQASSCRFLATHWASGNIVRVFDEDMLNCASVYVPSQAPGPDGVTNAVVSVS